MNQRQLLTSCVIRLPLRLSYCLRSYVMLFVSLNCCSRSEMCGWADFVLVMILFWLGIQDACRENKRHVTVIWQDTVGCCYNALKFVTILHSALWWQWQNANQILDSQNTSHTSRSRASYGVFFVKILEKIGRVITSPRCIWRYFSCIFLFSRW